MADVMHDGVVVGAECARFESSCRLQRRFRALLVETD